MMVGLTHFIHSLVQLGYDVVAVEGDLGPLEIIADAADESRAHIRAHLTDLLGLGAVNAQIVYEALYRGGVAAFGSEHHPASVEVHEH